MDGPLHIGSVQVRPGVVLPIVDCKGWYVAGREGRCRKRLDVSGCASCPQRVSRDGDLKNPPVYGRGEATKEPVAPVAPSAQAEIPSRVRVRGLGDVVHGVTSKLGIRECGGCKKRREALNRIVPFGKGEE